jgi:hypothetical protein
MKVFLEKLIFDNPIKEFPHLRFMKPERSLACSQEPTTSPSSVPDESSPHSQTPFL